MRICEGFKACNHKKNVIDGKIKVLTKDYNVHMTFMYDSSWKTRTTQH